MIVASYIFGALNVLTFFLALSGFTRAAAWLSILSQVPWSVYDVKTHQQGFLLIGAGTLVACVITLRKKARETLSGIPGTDDDTSGAPG